MGKRWTDEEEKFLRKNIKKMTYQEIADKLGKTFSSVCSKVNNLGINKYEIWDSDDEQKLIKYYLEDRLSVENIAKKMKRSRLNIVSKVTAMGLSRTHYKGWSDEHIKFLMDNSNTMTYPEIAKVLGKTTDAVRTKGLKLGLRKEVACWSDEQVKKLISEYSIKETSILAKELDKPKSAVSAKARKLGLKKEYWFWTEEMEKDMGKYYPDVNISITKIAKMVGKTVDEVYSKALKMNLYRIGPNEAWTTKQVKYVIDNYPTMSTVRIGAELDKTVENVARVARMYGVRKAKKIRMKIKRAPKRRSWTKEEDSFIRENVETMHAVKIACILKRPIRSLERRLKDLNIYDNRLKIYLRNGDISFYYNNDNEIQDKIDYCRFWQNELDKKSKMLGGYLFGRFVNFKKGSKSA